MEIGEDDQFCIRSELVSNFVYIDLEAILRATIEARDVGAEVRGDFEQKAVGGLFDKDVVAGRSRMAAMARWLAIEVPLVVKIPAPG
jgi:hypothetical protein